MRPMHSLSRGEEGEFEVEELGDRDAFDLLPSSHRRPVVLILSSKRTGSVLTSFFLQAYCGGGVGSDPATARLTNEDDTSASSTPLVRIFFSTSVFPSLTQFHLFHSLRPIFLAIVAFKPRPLPSILRRAFPRRVFSFFRHFPLPS